MAKKIRVWDGTAWQDVAPSLPYTAIHSAQASMPATGVDGQVWLDTDGTLADTAFVPLSGGTMTGNLNVPSINNGPIVGRNKILNGDFSINQRGFTTATNSNDYSFDRWRPRFVGDGTVTASAQTFSSGDSLIFDYEPVNYMRITTSGQSSTLARAQLEQWIEDVRLFAGQTVTFSFWAKAATGSPQVSVEIGQNFGVNGGAFNSVVSPKLNLSTTWQRYSVTLNVPSNSGKAVGANSFLFAGIWLSAGSDYASRSNSLPIQSNTFDIWGVQLEKGSQATPFHNSTPNQQTELAACQRYYWRSTLDTAYTIQGFGNGTSTTAATVYIPFPTQMRRVPTSVEFSGLMLTDWSSNIFGPTVSLNTDGYSSTRGGTLILTGMSGLIAQRFYFLMLAGNGVTTNYLGFSAEL